MGFDKAMDTPIAAQFMLHGLMGSGTELSFAHDSDVSTDLEQSDVLKFKVEELAENVRPGETKYFSSSMDYNDSNNQGAYPRYDQQLAYGKVKLAICIQKDAQGNISYSGRVADTYDFDWHEAELLDYFGSVKLGMNNGAVIAQKKGVLQPFNWKASIEGRIQGGKK